MAKHDFDTTLTEVINYATTNKILEYRETAMYDQGYNHMAQESGTKSFDGDCYQCGTYGHRASECKEQLSSKTARNKDNQKKQRSSGRWPANDSENRFRRQDQRHPRQAESQVRGQNYYFNNNEEVLQEEMYFHGEEMYLLMNVGKVIDQTPRLNRVHSQRSTPQEPENSSPNDEVRSNFESHKRLATQVQKLAVEVKHTRDHTNEVAAMNLKCVDTKQFSDKYMNKEQKWKKFWIVCSQSNADLTNF